MEKKNFLRVLTFWKTAESIQTNDDVQPLKRKADGHKHAGEKRRRTEANLPVNIVLEKNEDESVSIFGSNEGESCQINVTIQN